METPQEGLAEEEVVKRSGQERVCPRVPAGVGAGLAPAGPPVEAGAGRAAAVTARCFVAECRMDPPYWKPHAVGFVGAVAVSVHRERINTGDHSAVEQLPQTGPYRPQGRLWPGRAALGFLRQRPKPLAVCDLLRWRVLPCL